VTDVVSLELAGGELPNLDILSELIKSMHMSRCEEGYAKAGIRAMVNSGLMACVNRL
jgi:hypothetical protein